MYPDIEYVMKKRYLLTIVYHSGVLFLGVLGMLRVVRLVIEGTVVLSYFTSWVVYAGNTTSWEDLFAAHLPYISGTLLTAMLLAVMQQQLICWITPLPRPQCPQCGYDIKKITESRCSECGMELPAGLVKQPDSD